MTKTFLLFFFATASLAIAENTSADFPVQFSGCVEYVGTGPIPIAQALALVPPSFAVSNDGSGNATVVVRAARCTAVTVDGSKPEPGIVSHIGVSVVSPDGTGDINNYTIAYATDSPRLAQRLERAGLPALLDEDLVKEDSTPKLYVEVSPNGKAGWTITGTQTNTTLVTLPFLANWWYSGPKGIVKMSTDIPSITFKLAQGQVNTRTASAVGQLINGNTYSAFGARGFDFNVRGEFSTGLMSTTVR